jgi:hypothetical protein
MGTYFYDLVDPQEYYENLANNSSASTASSMQSQQKQKWYNIPDYSNKLVYKLEGVMPPIVQKILEEMGFVLWDEKIHDDEQWNILWKNSR